AIPAEAASPSRLRPPRPPAEAASPPGCGPLPPPAGPPPPRPRPRPLPPAAARPAPPAAGPRARGPAGRPRAPAARRPASRHGVGRGRLGGCVTGRAGAELVARVVAVDQVDPAGDGLDPVHDRGQVVPARVRVAGIQAESDGAVAALRGGEVGDGVPQAGDCL